MPTKKDKSAIDCVAMKRAIPSEIAAETQGMSRAEELAYYQERAAAGPLGALWRVAEKVSGVGTTNPGAPKRPAPSPSSRRAPRRGR